MPEKQDSRKCACGAKLNRWGEHRTVPRYNPAGGGKAAIPGGYERQHSRLFRVGIYPWGTHEHRRLAKERIPHD